MSGVARIARRGVPVGRRPPGLAGLDFARRLRPSTASRPLWVALVAGLLAGGLLLVALRIDIIRMRYGLAQALEREAALRGEQRELIVRDRRLRQPARLARLAAEQGYDRPAVVVHLSGASLEAPADASASASGSPPDVSAGRGVAP